MWLRSGQRKMSPVLPSLSPRLQAISLENIERLTGYTFLHQSSLVLSSNPNHLRNTTCLYLVSSALRKLCLPFFYKHRTGYTTFFNPPKEFFFDGHLSGVQPWCRAHPLRCSGFLVPLSLSM